MKVGIMQPYFMPYIGYFQLIKAVDKYVIYDDVNYIKGGWVTRNNILVGGEKKMFTITLKGASPNKLFNEIEIGDDFKKLMKTLQLNYSKSPFYNETMNLLERIVSYPNRKLSIFIANSIKEICFYLNVNTEILLSSNLQKNRLAKGQDKVLDICLLLKAHTYLNAIGGRELYDKEEFKKKGVLLEFIKTEISPYPQLSKEFVPHLSMIDVLMNNSKEHINYLLNCYYFV